ncbi:hypothetical protein [Phaeovulum sp. W22_SRMD_FR3]|uniref:hypothetical protein n=1 Tax=Phaeovulum sp. W22_SRMD_FR3 TaxID=3240274 RepID=UPI003F959F39
MTASPHRTAGIIVLEAYEYVHLDRQADYEAAGIVIDAICADAEPGMLVHALSQVGTAKGVVTYRWLEVFQGLPQLRAHLNSPHVAKHVSALQEGTLAAPTDLVIYGDVSAEDRATLSAELGPDRVTFSATVTSFFRQAEG